MHDQFVSRSKMPTLELFLNEPFCFGLELYRHAFKIREFSTGCKRSPAKPKNKLMVDGRRRL